MTTPHHAAAAAAPRQRRRPVTVPLSGVGLAAPIITSPCRLAGWSLQPALAADPAISATVDVVAAAAGTLTCTGFLAVSSVVVTPAAAWPAGANLLTLTNVTGGPVTCEIEGGTENAAILTFSPPIGVTGTPVATVPAIVGGPAFSIEATGLSSLAGVDNVGASLTLVDGGQTLAAITIPPNASSHVDLGVDGVYVGTSIAANVTFGSVSGAIFVLDDWHGGDN